MVRDGRKCGNFMIFQLFAQNPEIPPGTQNVSWDFGNFVRLLVPRGPNAPDLGIPMLFYILLGVSGALGLNFAKNDFSHEKS